MVRISRKVINETLSERASRPDTGNTGNTSYTQPPLNYVHIRAESLSLTAFIAYDHSSSSYEEWILKPNTRQYVAAYFYNDMNRKCTCLKESGHPGTFYKKQS